MIAAWSRAAFRYKPDVLIVGTDPVLSLLTALPWNLIRPRTRIVHWCFDLYPEAAIADGVLTANSLITRLARRLMRSAYSHCDLLVDIGSCMRRLLQRYKPKARFATLTPWALAEPAKPAAIDPTERAALFGESRLALLYSGNFGRAHSCDRTLALARRLRDESVSLVFSVRGNAQAALQASFTPRDSNISLAGFAPQAPLEARLSAADIHVVSLREEWTGTVIPSKFFGALAVGRPVLFEGSPDCAIAQWIKEFQVGWVLAAGTEDAVAAELAQLSREPHRLPQLFEHCHSVYAANFSRTRMVDAWDRELCRL